VPSFDDLPIPFRAVATDIETGLKVVIDHGELAGAMRASMSVPAVFAPYQWEGKLLVDGGMADNVPIDVARAMGADIVIVAATQTPLAKGADVRSAPQVLGQTVTLLILANERQQLATLKPGDVLIPVDTKALGAGDFKRGPELIAAGRVSALTKEAELTRLAAARGPSPPLPPAPPVKTVDYVRIENDSKIDDAILARRVQRFVGKPMDTEQIVAALQSIYAIGVFTRVDFTVEERDGKTGLVVQAVQREGDTNRLRPGLTIGFQGKGRAEFDLSLEFRALQLDRFGSEARFVGVLGNRKELSGEYFKLLDRDRQWFVAPSFDLVARPVPIYDSGGFRLGEYDARYGVATLAAGRQFGGVGELRAGITAGLGEATAQEGLVLPRKQDLDVGQLFVSAGYDKLDNAFFPTRGGRAQLNYTWGTRDLGDARNYEKIGGSAIYALGTRRDTFIVGVEGGDTVDGRAPVAQLYTLGGPFSFPGYNVDELTGETYAVARAMYRHRLTDNATALLHVPLYVGVTLAGGNIWARHGDFNSSDLRVGGAVFVAADTLIGPVFLSLGAADRGRTAAYVFVGRPF
jgi:NTE family protein